MKVGDYVRTKYGITQYREYDTQYGKKILAMPIKNIIEGFFANMGDVIKFGNLIDVIEVGDYLNGWRVNYLEKNSGGNGTIIKIGNTTFNVLEDEDIYTPCSEQDGSYQKIEKLKSIVTKEQFESMEYKIESEE